MSRLPSLTASADPARDMPADPAGRFETITRALLSLDVEERRLLRLGLELPLARCREQQRYWRFLRALFVGATDPRTLAETEVHWLPTSR